MKTETIKINNDYFEGYLEIVERDQTGKNDTINFVIDDFTDDKFNDDDFDNIENLVIELYYSNDLENLNTILQNTEF